MNYTIMTASDDWCALDLIKSGAKYLITLWGIQVHRMLDKWEFSTLAEAKREYLAKCEKSDITPVEIEHDLDDFYANYD